MGVSAVDVVVGTMPRIASAFLCTTHVELCFFAILVLARDVASIVAQDKTLRAMIRAAHPCFGTTTVQIDIRAFTPLAFEMRSVVFEKITIRRGVIGADGPRLTAYFMIFLGAFKARAEQWLNGVLLGISSWASKRKALCLLLAASVNVNI